MTTKHITELGELAVRLYEQHRPERLLWLQQVEVTPAPRSSLHLVLALHDSKEKQ